MSSRCGDAKMMIGEWITLEYVKAINYEKEKKARWLIDLLDRL